MPNINEFINPKPEKLASTELQTVIGDKGCSKCDGTAKEAYWDAIKLEMTWTCPSGHKNSFRFN